MMSIREAIRETLDEFLEMSSDELDKVIEQHKEGDIALSLLESGYFVEPYRNKIEYYQLFKFGQRIKQSSPYSQAVANMMRKKSYPCRIAIPIRNRRKVRYSVFDED